MSLFKQYLEMAQKAIPLKKPKNFKNQLEDVIDRLVKNQDHKNKKTIKIHTSNLGFQGKFDTHFADAIYQLKDAYKKAGWDISYKDSWIVLNKTVYEK